MASDTEPDMASAAAVPYRVLARKYRPRSFDDLIGQEPMVRTLTNAFDAGRIAQAWMLTGVRGVGKTTTARILARALNYETASIHRPTIHMDEPGIHDAAIMEGRHVDVVEMDAASHTGIDDIREIIAQVRYRPVSARYKVYIIDEVHMLSTQAFNGLLKTLEEPPEHVKFVFATTEIRKVPITVLSRCQRFDLRRVEAGELIAHLKRVLKEEDVAADENALRLIARAAEGSVRDALSLADQAIAHGAGRIEEGTARDMLGLADRVRVIDLFEHLMRGDARAAITELRDQHASGADPAIVLAELADFTHLVTTLRFVPEAAEDAALSPAEAERGRAFAQTLSVRTLGQVWQMLLKAVEEARLAASPRQAAEMALIRIAHAADMPSPEDLARAILDGEDPGLPSPVPRAPQSNGGTTSLAPPAPAAGPTMPVAPVPPRPPAQASAGRIGLAARMLSPSAEPAPMRAVPPQASGDAGEGPTSLEDLDALALEKRDSRMRVWIRRYVRLVRIEPGRLEIEIAGSAPVSLAGDLAKRLNDWTGRRWVVSLATSGGGPTLDEAAAARRKALIEEAARDPEVAAILAMMPGASIREVRLRGEAEGEAPDEAIADIELDDGLPEQIDIDPADDLTGFDAAEGDFNTDEDGDEDS